jgi:hypothetical protein
MVVMISPSSPPEPPDVLPSTSVEMSDDQYVVPSDNSADAL